MVKFKIWLENSEKDKVKELKSIWADTFRALGIEGLSDEDASQQSLSKITFNQRNTEKPNNFFRGKQATRKRLDNGQIFSRLEGLNDPEMKKNIEDTRRWLDTKNQEQTANASTTVSLLLQKLFGKEIFEKFIDADFPKVDDTKPAPKTETMPPKQNPVQQNQQQNSPESQPDNTQVDSGMDEPMAGMMGQQPQPSVNQNPQSPMPPKPAGAELGMF
jgi:hypothetical protein